MQHYPAIDPVEWKYTQTHTTSPGLHQHWHFNIKDAKGITPRVRLPACAGQHVRMSVPHLTPFDRPIHYLDLRITDEATIETFERVDKKNCEVAAEMIKSVYNKNVPIQDIYNVLYERPIRRHSGVLRTEIPINTIVYVAIEDTETGAEIYRKGTIDDIFDYTEAGGKCCRVSPVVEFESIHLSPRKWSMSVVCKDIIVWP